MIGGRLPDVPDPSAIVAAGALAAKAVGDGITAAGSDLANGAEQILFSTINGSMDTVNSAAKSLAQMAKSNIDAGKTTVDKVLSDIDRACSSVLSQVDKAVGQEIVRKFKNEIQSLLR